MGVGVAAGAAGCSGDADGTNSDPTASGNTDSETDTSTGEATEQPTEEETANDDKQNQEDEARKMVTDNSPVQAEGYINAVAEADSLADTEKLTAAMSGAGGTYEILEQTVEEEIPDPTVNTAGKAHGLAKTVYQLQNEEGRTEYPNVVVDVVPGKINANEHNYILVQPVEGNGQLGQPLIHGPGFGPGSSIATYKPGEKNEQDTQMLNRLHDNSDTLLAFPHDMTAVYESEKEVDEIDPKYVMEKHMSNWSASMLGVNSGDDVPLRPEDYQSGILWAGSRGLGLPDPNGELAEEVDNLDEIVSVAEELEYGDIAGEVQDQYFGSEYDNGSWTGFGTELVENSRGEIEDVNVYLNGDTRLRDAL
jgi:hypothetical protein